MTSSRVVIGAVGRSRLDRPGAAPPPAVSDGHHSRDLKAMLLKAGLRPTRQRLALGELLFAKGNRHTTAEVLHGEAIAARIPVSLATIYNTLNQLTNVGLLRQVPVDGSKMYFDTNLSEHQHFYLEGDNELLDIADANSIESKWPIPPEGYEIVRIDIVIRLRRSSR
jgi:Fur family transcriptional regulator, iron response regulator